MLQRLELTEGQHRQIQTHCRAIGIEFFSTPFSVQAVEMLLPLLNSEDGPVRLAAYEALGFSLHKRYDIGEWSSLLLHNAKA